MGGTTDIWALGDVPENCSADWTSNQQLGFFGRRGQPKAATFACLLNLKPSSSMSYLLLLALPLHTYSLPIPHSEVLDLVKVTHLLHSVPINESQGHTRFLNDNCTGCSKTWKNSEHLFPNHVSENYLRTSSSKMREQTKYRKRRATGHSGSNSGAVKGSPGMTEQQQVLKMMGPHPTSLEDRAPQKTWQDHMFVGDKEIHLLHII